MIQDKVEWAEFKDFVDSRELSIQYRNINGSYWLKAYDFNYVNICLIPQTTPRNAAQEDFEDNYLASANQAFGNLQFDENKRLLTNPKSFIDTSVVSSNFTVGTSQVEAKVGGSRLADRKMLYIENTGNFPIFYGPSGVTTSGSNRGAELRRREFVFLPIGDVAIFVISTNASGQVTVQEFA